MKKQQKIQITLILIGFLLIFTTYFYYPYMSRTKFVEDQPTHEDLEGIQDDERTFFKSVEYKGFYDLNKPFIVKSEKAYILSGDPDVMHMTNMHVILYLSDGRIVNIISNKGKYNKVTYDCFFEDNVKAVDDKTTILAENLDLLATENSANVYNNVILTNDKGSLQADKVHYDILEKNYKISMFDDKNNKVKIKLIKWVTLKNLGL